MKILPDYLIQYMPELEDALEELRLSILDHAYELLKSLDVDELSTDDIRQKLELYDIKVDNMSSEWLPNGRFYRVYPSIKHHRSRQNTINAIAKSGGQFEGLWSDDFNKKSEYQFNKINVLRHYEISSNADGYFFVNGNIERDAHGKIISSAAHALSTDILINQSLPAGYTYLYLPFPRPVYPADAGYFYNVHMLMHDRLQYADDCEAEQPEIVEGDTPASMRYDWKNGSNTPWHTPYWFDYHYMNSMTKFDPVGDVGGSWPIREKGTYKDADGYDTDDPSNAVDYKLAEECKSLADPESVFPTKCYVASKNKTTVPNRDTKFTPAIIDHDDVFYTEDENYKTDDSADTAPGAYRHDVLSSASFKIREIANHFKEYRPFWNDITLFTDMCSRGNTYDYSSYSITIESVSGNLSEFASVLYDNTRLSNNVIDAVLNNLPGTLPCAFTHDRAEQLEAILTNAGGSVSVSLKDERVYNNEKLTKIILVGRTQAERAYVNLIKGIREIYGLGLAEAKAFVDSAPIELYVPISGTFANSSLEDILHAIEESCGVVELQVSPQKCDSLYNWINLNKNNSRPVSDSPLYGDSIIKSNNPIISEEVFTSYHRPTRGKLDPLYVGYLSNEVSGQDENYEITPLQRIFSFDSDPDASVNPAEIPYDPKYYYNIISLNYKDDTNQVEIYNHTANSYYEKEDIYAALVGDPSSKTLRLVKKANESHHTGGYNYITFKKSETHKLWFAANHKNATIVSQSTGTSNGTLYNILGSDHVYDYSDNTTIITYEIIGVYDENDNSLNYTSGSISCFIEKINDNESKYHVEYNDLKSGDSLIRVAAYILFRVKTRPGQLNYTARTELEPPHKSFFNFGVLGVQWLNAGEFEYHEAPVELQTPMGGVITETSDTIVETPIAVSLERGSINFTGTLTENIIPESGVIEEYIPGPKMFGVLNSTSDKAIRLDNLPFGIIEQSLPE
jgi:ribosomal protein L7/L12